MVDTTDTDSPGTIPPENWESVPTKARLLNLRTGEFLTFIYNPPDLRTNENTKWGQVEIPGAANAYYQFITGGETTIPLSILLNEYGEGKRYRKDYVENSIKFLRDAMTPRKIEFGGEEGGRIIRQAPDVLRFFWGMIRFGEVAPGISVVINGMEVDRSMFRGEDGMAIRAVVELELKKWVTV